MLSGTIIRRVGLAAAIIFALISIVPSVRPTHADETPGAAQVQMAVDSALHDMIKGRFESALTKVEDALKADPKNVSANQLRADVCSLWQPEYNKSKLEESKKVLAEQNAPLSYVTTVTESIGGGQTDAAIQQMKKIIQETPESDRRSLNQYILALAYLKASKGAEAFDALNEALGWDGEFEEAYYDLANMYMQLGRSNEALRMTELLLDRNKSNEDWLLLRAAISASTDRTGEAVWIASGLLKKFENMKIETGRRVGLAHHVLALANFRNFIAMPEKAKMDELMAPALAECANAENAPDVTKKLSALDNAISKAVPIISQANLGEQINLIGKAKAEKDKDKQAAAAQDALDNLKKFLTELGDRKEKFRKDMLDNADLAIKADSTMSEPYNLRASYYIRENGPDPAKVAENLAKATEDYDAYLKIRPDSTTQRYYLGIVRLIQGEAEGKFDEASKIFSEIKDADGSVNEMSYMGAGLVAGLTGNADAARKAFEDLRAVREKKQLGENAFFELMLAHACLAQGKGDDAKPHLKVGASALGGLAITPETNYADLLGPADITAADIGKLNFSLALTDAGFTEQAIAECDKFLEAVKTSVAGRFFHFMLIRNKPELLDAAKSDLESLRRDFEQKDPKNVTPYLATALLYSDMRAKSATEKEGKEYEDKMIAEYEAAIKANPDFGNTYAIYAQLLVSRGQIYQAVEKAKEGFDKDPINRALMQAYTQAVQLGGEKKPKDFIPNIYKQYIKGVEDLTEPGVDPLDGMLALASYYRQIGQTKDAFAEFSAVRDMIEGIKDAQEKENQRKKYLLAYMNLRELSLAESKTDDARKYNSEVRAISPETPGSDHFEGLCALIEGKNDEAQKAFEAEVAKGSLSMTTAMSKAGLAVIALKRAASAKDVDAVHALIESGLKMEDLILKREKEIYGRDATNVRTMGGYLSFVSVCAFLAQSKFEQAENPGTESHKIGYAAKRLNKASVLFPGSEGLLATETTAFKGINLANDVLAKWDSDKENGPNFSDLAIGSFFLGQGVFREAVNHLENEIAKNPNNFIALLFEARAQKALGNEPRAVELLKKCQDDAEGKKFIPAYTELYFIYMSRDVKDHAAIRGILEAMCGIDPMFRHEYARYLAEDYVSAKEGENFDLAIEQYEILIKEKNLPDRYVALNGAAWLIVQHHGGDKDALAKAEQDAREAVKLVEAQPEIQPGARKIVLLATINDTLAWILYNEGKLTNDAKKYQEAAPIFEKCVSDLLQVTPNQESVATVLYHMALAHDALRVAAGSDKAKAGASTTKAVQALRLAVRYPKFTEKKQAEELLKTLEPLMPPEETATPSPAPTPETPSPAPSPAPGTGTPAPTPEPPVPAPAPEPTPAPPAPGPSSP